MAETYEHTLAPLQRRQVLALAAEQARLNQEAQEVQEALIDLARRYLADRSEEGGQPHFELRGEEVVLVVVRAPVEAPEEETNGSKNL